MNKNTNREFAFKFFHHRILKKSNKGFTLIELLVVVIIIGVLSAVALPNLLGQVAKGRQAEAKNNLGAINRAQQAYRLENLVFAVKDDLPIQLSWQYYQVFMWDPQSYPYTPIATVSVKALDQYQDDILDYEGAVIQTKTGNSVQIICEEKSLNFNNNGNPFFVQPMGVPPYTGLRCNTKGKAIK